MALDLKATVSLDGSGFEKGIEKITESLKGFAVSAFGVYGIEQAIHKTIETAENLLDTANRLGIVPDKFQEIAFAAKQSHLEMETLTKIIEKINQTRFDPKFLEVYQRFGIGAPGKGDVSDILTQLSANVRTRNPQEFIGDLRKIGGKSAGEAINLLRDDLAALEEEARRVGAVISTEDLVALKFLADEMKILGDIVIAQLAPAIIKIGEVIVGVLAILKGEFTFWQSLISNLKGSNAFGTIAKQWATMGIGMKSGELDAAFRDISDAWKKAGATSESDLQGSAEKFVSLRNSLMAKQHLLELMGAFPDIPFTAAGRKARSESIDSNSLLAVGNFLGQGTSSPEVEVLNIHTEILRAIEQNTRTFDYKMSSIDHRLPDL